MALTVRSLGWDPGARIPARFTVDGADKSPGIEFAGADRDARSFALVFDDPDAPGGTWTHWVIYNIPGTARGIAAGVPPTEVLAEGMRQGRNSWAEIGYRGPSPPPGKPHRYILHLYALREMVPATPGLTASTLRGLLRPNVLATASHLGVYERQATDRRGSRALRKT